MTGGGGLPLVGRDEVLADVRAAVEQARASHGGLVLVTGEAGIGKTRLATEALNQAQGFRMVWSWCASDPAGGSFRPWLQVVRGLAAADAQAARVVATSPWLVGLISHEVLPSDAPDGGETARWQFFDAVADVVQAAAATTPWLIILDDVHDAQESSLWLLAHLVPTLRSSAALVLATARDGEQAWHGHVEAHAALGQSPPDVLTERVLARTGGNPLLVVELIRSVGERPDNTAFAAAVPASVRAITAERLVGFSPICQRLLSGAAVLGTRFGLDVLAEIVEVDLAAVRGRLGEAEAIGLVEFSEPGDGRFVHELIRDAVYDWLDPAERRRWHERAASALTTAAHRGRDIATADVAHHLLLAGPELADRAAQFAELAGDRAAELLAFEDAVSWYERALRALDLAGGGRARRASLALAMSEVWAASRSS